MGLEIHIVILLGGGALIPIIRFERGHMPWAIPYWRDDMIQVWMIPPHAIRIRGMDMMVPPDTIGSRGDDMVHPRSGIFDPYLRDGP